MVKYKNILMLLFVLTLISVQPLSADVCTVFKPDGYDYISSDPLGSSFPLFQETHQNSNQCITTDESPPNTICTNIQYEEISSIWTNGIDNDQDQAGIVVVQWREVTSVTYSATPTQNWDSNITGSQQYIWRRNCDCATCQNLDDAQNPCEGKENESPFTASAAGGGFICYSGCEAVSSIGSSISLSVHGRNGNPIQTWSYTGEECQTDSEIAEEPPSDVSVVINGNNYYLEAPEVTATIPFAVATGGWEQYLKNTNPTLDFDVVESPGEVPEDNIPKSPPLENQVAEVSIQTDDQATGTTGTTRILIGTKSDAGTTTNTSTTTDNGDGTTTTTSTGTINLRPITDAISGQTSTLTSAINGASTATNQGLSEINSKLDGLTEDTEFDEESLEGGGSAPTISESLQSFQDRATASPLLSAVGNLTFPGAAPCSTFTIDAASFGTFSTDIPCNLWNTLSPILGGIMIFVWGFVGFRILFSA
jgi:hypothetical protein